ncbi:prepilin-type N-terminal cleavage/methylation domain-containing protein [Parashewanella curva]|uniref:Prepilin-type N-terminal cleavage/methylation domain-containing protein n=1 Tax=Parashewanella curva TaxID=2338552 RepID=A0A3L8PUN9_9GAMM|nr:type II secretion system protein [Parashewanella curva]RLV59040.1 prepilin-type N-terminal cleavage/methylation domain-containing protein [Parashewanella curva]
MITSTLETPTRRADLGFTLVELVIVIIVLGILAVVAAPKFINYKGDARVAALKEMESTLKTANALIYSKALLQGKAKIDAMYKPAVDIGTGKPLDTNYGYMQARIDEIENATGIQFAKAVNARSHDLVAGTDQGQDWIMLSDNTGRVEIWQRGDPEKCYISYTEARGTLLPEYSKLPKPSDCS